MARIRIECHFFSERLILKRFRVRPWESQRLTGGMTHANSILSLEAMTMTKINLLSTRAARSTRIFAAMRRAQSSDFQWAKCGDRKRADSAFEAYGRLWLYLRLGQPVKAARLRR